MTSLHGTASRAGIRVRSFGSPDPALKAAKMCLPGSVNPATCPCSSSSTKASSARRPVCSPVAVPPRPPPCRPKLPTDPLRVWAALLELSQRPAGRSLDGSPPSIAGIRSRKSPASSFNQLRVPVHALQGRGQVERAGRGAPARRAAGVVVGCGHEALEDFEELLGSERLGDIGVHARFAGSGRGRP